MASERAKRARISAASCTPSRSMSASVGGGSVTTPLRMASRSWRSTSAASSHTLLALQLAQHVLRAFQVPTEDLPCHVQQLADGGVAHGVAHGDAVFPGLDDVLRAQPRQVLGHDRLVELQRLLQLLDAATAVAKDLEDADAHGMAERLEELGFQGL